MEKYSHQYLIAFTIENEEKDHEKIPYNDLLAGLVRRMGDIVEHDGIEAFQHNDTEEI